MTPFDLKQAISEKYLSPIQRPRDSFLGVELEFPIVQLQGQPVDFSVVHALAEAFLQEFSITTYQRDEKGHIYAATALQTGDGLSFDCSYNTLELSFGRERNLHQIAKRYRRYYTWIQSYLLPRNHSLTGMGINPNYAVNRNVPIPSGRYRMLYHHLSSYPNYGDALPFHHYPNFGFFSCASQVQLDVDQSNVLQVLNTFSLLEPVKTILFANSLWEDKLCGRDAFWKNSLHGLNPRNVDMFAQPLASIEELVDYISKMSLYCTERDGKYINFSPIPLENYFAMSKIRGEYYDGGRYQTILFEPKPEDLQYLRSFKFEDLTYRGTVEFRSVCEQPAADAFAPAAFHAGLLEELPALTALLREDTALFGHGLDASALREALNQKVWPDWLVPEKVSGLCLSVLALAEKGLKQRGYGEEQFLLPLWHRAETLVSPARHLEQQLRQGVPMEKLVQQYANLG